MEDPTPTSMGGRCWSRAACSVSGEALSSLWWVVGQKGVAGRRRARALEAVAGPQCPSPTPGGKLEPPEEARG